MCEHFAFTLRSLKCSAKENINESEKLIISNRGKKLPIVIVLSLYNQNRNTISENCWFEFLLIQ